MKTITAALTALTLALVAALPVHAQQDMVNLHFRLAVQGVPCPGTTYWGFFGLANTDDVNYVQLTDPDGDGVYTGTGTHLPAATMVVRIIQGTGTDTATTIGGESTFEVPGEPSRVVRDFGSENPDAPGLVPHLIIHQDMTFEASVAGCPAGLPDTGASNHLPILPLAGAVLLLTSDAYLRRWIRQPT